MKYNLLISLLITTSIASVNGAGSLQSKPSLISSTMGGRPLNEQPAAALPPATLLSYQPRAGLTTASLPVALSPPAQALVKAREQARSRLNHALVGSQKLVAQEERMILGLTISQDSLIQTLSKALKIYKKFMEAEATVEAEATSKLAPDLVTGIAIMIIGWTP